MTDRRTGLPLIMARALQTFAPPQSEIHQIIAEADRVVAANKEQAQREQSERAALKTQINRLQKTEQS